MFRLEREWSNGWNGKSFRIVKSPANNFWVPPRPESDIGRQGKLRRDKFHGDMAIFTPNPLAWAKGFSGVSVNIDVDGRIIRALIEEIEFL